VVRAGLRLLEASEALGLADSSRQTARMADRSGP
jgi:hypothetical protein